MVRLFLATFLAGLAIVLVAAGVFPLPEHVRFRSQSEALTGGGRQEDFLIRWPEDRIAIPGSERLAESTVAAGSVALRTSDAGLAGAELFRLRDTDGNVIGVASRTTARVQGQRVPSASVSNWMLMIPSRGTLLLSQENSADIGPIWSQRGPGGYLSPAETAEFWSRGSRYRITAGPARDGQGKVVRGTQEFAELAGTYTEIWELEEIRADATTEGQILISTITKRNR